MADKRLTTHAECVVAANKVREALTRYNQAVHDANEVSVSVVAYIAGDGLVALKSVSLEIKL